MHEEEERNTEIREDDPVDEGRLIRNRIRNRIREDSDHGVAKAFALAMRAEGMLDADDAEFSDLAQKAFPVEPPLTPDKVLTFLTDEDEDFDKYCEAKTLQAMAENGEAENIFPPGVLNMVKGNPEKLVQMLEDRIEQITGQRPDVHRMIRQTRQAFEKKEINKDEVEAKLRAKLEELVENFVSNFVAIADQVPLEELDFVDMAVVGLGKAQPVGGRDSFEAVISSFSTKIHAHQYALAIILTDALKNSHEIVQQEALRRPHR